MCFPPPPLSAINVLAIPKDCAGWGEGGTSNLPIISPYAKQQKPKDASPQDNNNSSSPPLPRFQGVVWKGGKLVSLCHLSRPDIFKMLPTPPHAYTFFPLILHSDGWFERGEILGNKSITDEKRAGGNQFFCSH